MQESKFISVTSNQEIVDGSLYTSSVISLSPNAIVVQAWLLITVESEGSPTGVLRVKVAPYVTATDVLYSSGADIPLSIPAAGTYNFAVILGQLDAEQKIVLTNNSGGAVTVTTDLRFVEVK